MNQDVNILGRKLSENLGVSVVICTFNGANRLPQTLSHLAQQRLDRAIDWEVVVVNNASTDNTKEITNECWRGVACAELRVVDEPKLGISNARRRGFEEARHEIVSFVDDDNWVCSNWVETVSEVMSRNPEVGACGGRSEAVFEITPPEWFEDFRAMFAVGALGDHACEVPEDPGWLWGAGLSIRKRAWQLLVDQGFQFHVIGREGHNLSSASCEDIELCYALRSAGYRLWFDPSLRIKHYITKRRLNWNYLLGLHRGVGIASATLDGYIRLFERRENTLRNRLRYTWKYQTLTGLKVLLEHSVKKSTLDRGTHEYRRNDCFCKFLTARLVTLLRMRKIYDDRIKAIGSARWLTDSISLPTK
jgi:glycosyltransferase involved in cell wall biosynthesis